MSELLPGLDIRSKLLAIALAPLSVLLALVMLAQLYSQQLSNQQDATGAGALLLAFSVCTVLAVVMALIAASHLTRRIEGAIRAVDSFSSGHLDTEITETGEDEAGVLLDALRHMQKDFRNNTAVCRPMADNSGHGLNSMDSHLQEQNK